jgi:histone H3/H4
METKFLNCIKKLMRYSNARQINHSSKELLYNIILQFSKKIHKKINSNYYLGKKLNICDIQFIFTEIFNGNILNIILNLKINQKTVFSEKSFHKYFNGNNNLTKKTTKYICLSLEYFLYDILESSQHICNENGKIRIKREHIVSAIKNDIELSYIFNKNNILILDDVNIYIKKNYFNNYVKNIVNEYNLKITKPVLSFFKNYYENIINNILSKSNIICKNNKRKIINSNDIECIIHNHSQHKIEIIDIKYDITYDEIDNFVNTNVENHINNYIDDIFENNHILDVQIV